MSFINLIIDGGWNIETGTNNQYFSPSTYVTNGSIMDLFITWKHKLWSFFINFLFSLIMPQITPKPLVQAFLSFFFLDKGDRGVSVFETT